MDIDLQMNPANGWQVIDDIEIGGRLSISDTSYFYDHPVIVGLAAGNYSAWVRYILPEGHKHIAGVRVAAAGTLTSARWAGNVLVDFGQIGICDRDAVESAFNMLGDGGMAAYYDQLNTTALAEWVRLPGPAKMLIFRPGFGDGTYAVYELLRPNGTSGGIEIDCLHPLR